MHIFTNMKKEIFEEIILPEGVKATIEKNKIILEGKEGKTEKKINFGELEIQEKDNTIKVGCKNATKAEKKMIYTILAHIKNLIKGVENKYEYKLKICFNHFPVTIDIDKKQAKIKNFLGETVPRTAQILDNV